MGVAATVQFGATVAVTGKVVVAVAAYAPPVRASSTPAETPERIFEVRILVLVVVVSSEIHTRGILPRYRSPRL